MEFESTDSSLQQFGITCVHFGDAKNNLISIAEGAQSHAPLTIDIAGSNNHLTFIGSRLPNKVIRCLGDNSKLIIDSDAVVSCDLWLYNGAYLEIKKPRAIFGLYASIYPSTRVIIMPGCLIAEDVEIWTADFHSIIDLNTFKQVNFPADVILQSDVWMCRRSMVLKGVTIGEGSVVSAMSLVRSDIPNFELWGGVPAKPIRKNITWLSAHPAQDDALAALRSRVEGGFNHSPKG
jgi:acetyltransferase-like isoleucine patch superfamily enzyme